MSIQWYFSANTKVNREVADKFIDTKFSINKFNSFAREIIQNSLDAADSEGEIKRPVFVKFELREFELKDIPGGEKTKEILNCCISQKKINFSTREIYKSGIETLNTNKIKCLKISDENTTGVGTTDGRNDEWGALVYDSGVSVKKRPGSAGSHGVGKKVPFIMSAVRTVYYSTINDNGLFFEGKSMLIDWEDRNGDKHIADGWYGEYNEQCQDFTKKILPISKTEDLSNINDWFIRKDKKGTDIIIEAIQITDDKVDECKNKIITAILENFFVAIYENKLECDVFGQYINKDNMQEVINKLNFRRGRNFERDDAYTNIINGNLKNYFEAFQMQPEIIPIKNDGQIYGNLNIFFNLKNDKNRKFYCIVREHGMKIKDVEVSDADQAFSAVVIIKDVPGTDKAHSINAILASRENPAHDDFITRDNSIPCDPVHKQLIDSIKTLIENYIIKLTKLAVGPETPIGDSDDILGFAGKLEQSNGRILNKTRRHKRRRGATRTSSFGEGIVPGVGITDNPIEGEGENKPGKKGNDFLGLIPEDFALEPGFVNQDNKNYILKFKLIEPAKRMKINIFPISSDGSKNNVGDIVDSIKNISDKRYKIEFDKNQMNTIYLKNVEANEMIKLNVVLKSGLNYTLGCEISVGGNNEK